VVYLMTQKLYPRGENSHYHWVGDRMGRGTCLEILEKSFVSHIGSSNSLPSPLLKLKQYIYCRNENAIRCKNSSLKVKVFAVQAVTACKWSRGMGSSFTFWNEPPYTSNRMLHRLQSR
jgi:hypothetical protein